ncbi:membrane protein [Spirochaetia bacterium]|nr:membrane protein [Spirochaetia bacterium]
MLGPIVNALVILVCSLIGCFALKNISARFENIIKQALSLSIIFLGIKGAMENQNVLLLIMSMVIGALIGEAIDIDALMNKGGQWAQRKLGERQQNQTYPNTANTKHTKNKNNNFAKAFVTASILFCSGSMAIVGSMQSGLQGNHEMLFAKSILDGSISIVFAASMGIGVAFSAIPVLLYQGAIALAAMAVRGLLTEQIIREMSASGSLIIAAIGFNFLGIKEIKVANLIPAAFVPLVYFVILGLF